VNCPDRRRLELFGLGQLSAAEQESCAAHLDECTSCRQCLAELDGLEDSLVRELRDTRGREPASENLLRRLVPRPG
jgi:anti-sigma factor RsiW